MYPEHEKMKAIAAESNRIGDFIDWLEMQDLHICERVITYRDGFEYERTTRPMEKLLAEFYEIDLKKIDAEKRQMLKAMQELNAS